jgi:hypothetical protein
MLGPLRGFGLADPAHDEARVALARPQAPEEGLVDAVRAVVDRPPQERPHLGLEEPAVGMEGQRALRPAPHRARPEALLPGLPDVRGDARHVGEPVELGQAAGLEDLVGVVEVGAGGDRVRTLRVEEEGDVEAELVAKVAHKLLGLPGPGPIPDVGEDGDPGLHAAALLAGVNRSRKACTVSA